MALISSKAINGKDEVVFDNRPNARNRYKLNDVVVPGVTTFIKAGMPTSEGLIGWKIGKGAEFALSQYESDLSKEEIIKLAKTAWKKDAEEAAGIGVIIHEYAEICGMKQREKAVQMLCQYQSHDKWEAITNAVYKVDQFDEANKDELLFTEQIVGSPLYGFAGRFDRLVRRGNKIIISDYKTSKGFFLDQFVQDAAYSIAIGEWLDIRVDGFEVVRFGKEGGDFQSLLVDDPGELARLRDQALRCLDTYRELKFWSKDKRFKKPDAVNETAAVL
jgi:hypothetical protein